MKTFAYYGGKTSHLRRILPLLPQVSHFCEPFAGSAAVLVAREPSKIETLNDASGDVANFWRVLRDESIELRRRIETTPFSRSEFALSVAAQTVPPSCPVERARLFFVRLGQGRMAKPKTTRGQWSWSRDGKGPAAAASWLSRVARLEALASRIRHVQVDEGSAVSCIERHDSVDTLFYCDPPYEPSTRNISSRNTYSEEMSGTDHASFLTTILAIKGFACISGYASPLYDERLAGWRRIAWRSTARQGVGGRRCSDREEVCWLNYE